MKKLKWDFERGTKELFESRLLSKEQKFKLLELCYDKKEGREYTFRKFLDYLDILVLLGILGSICILISKKRSK